MDGPIDNFMVEKIFSFRQSLLAAPAGGEMYQKAGNLDIPSNTACQFARKPPHGAVFESE